MFDEADKNAADQKAEPNVEFYAGVMMEQYGVRHQMVTPTCISSRVMGLCTNVVGQAVDTQVIRKNFRHIGPLPPLVEEVHTAAPTRWWS